MMQPDAIYAYPLWAVGAAMAAGTIAAVALTEILATWLIGAELRRRHNELTASIFTITGTTYAVLLAFVAMLAWDNYGAADAATSREAARLADVASLALGLPAAPEAALRADLRDYAEAVRTVEWPAQAAGRSSRAGDGPLAHAEGLVMGLQPANVGQANLQEALLRAFDRLRDARSLRIAASTSSIPPVVWFVVVAGGAISLAFAALLGAHSRALHLGLGALLALSGTLVLVMIVALSHPFRGEFRITPAPFASAVATMQG